MGCRCVGITWDVLSGRGETLRKGRKMLHKEAGLGPNPFRSIDGVGWAGLSTDLSSYWDLKGLPIQR